jgi:UDP-N-acetylglucosamine transferase subunit ALG13
MCGQPLRVFVATGTGPSFERLLAAIRPIVGDPAYELFVQRGAGGPLFPELPGADFISRPEFAQRLLWADVVIAHGGAGTVYEAYLAGHTPIIVPRLARHSEVVNDHQLELAVALESSQKAHLASTDVDLRAAIAAVPRRMPARSQAHGPLVNLVHDMVRHAPSRRRRKIFDVARSLVRRALDR